MTLAKLIKPKNISGDTPFDIILKAWLGHKINDLPEEYQKMLERWKMADSLIRSCIKVEGETKVYRQNDIVQYLIENFDVSARTAYDDIANAKRFFLSFERRDDKEFARGVMIEWGEKMMFHAFDKGDYKAAAAFYKELNDIKGLHQQTVDTPDYSEFIPPSLVLTDDPKDLGFDPVENKDELVKRILGEKMDDFIQSEAEDAEVMADE